MASYFTAGNFMRGHRPSKLRALPPAARAEIVRALDDSIRHIQATAVTLAPMRTGTLRRALSAPQAIGRRKQGLEVEFGLRTKSLQRRAFYAPFVEYGTRGYSTGGIRLRGVTREGLGRYRKIKRNIPARPAQPFLRPAIRINIPFWQRAVRGALQRALRQLPRV